ncbi:MAG: 50S ribosomal protein L9 [Candidatus Omnitrophica bacterium]|nr:50S ribosomal protein L9 [Candidatus Omnitrophota bacterium]
MRVIFVKDFPGKGKKEEIKEVRTGYARNYLIPEGIAVEATEHNIRLLKNQEHMLEAKKKKILFHAKETRNALRDASITVNAKAGQDDKLFGAVTSEDIAEAINKQKNVEIDKHQILIEQPIKKLGIYKIPVRFSEEVSGEVKIWVVREK